MIFIIPKYRLSLPLLWRPVSGLEKKIPKVMLWHIWASKSAIVQHLSILSRAKTVTGGMWVARLWPGCSQDRVTGLLLLSHCPPMSTPGGYQHSAPGHLLWCHLWLTCARIVSRCSPDAKYIHLCSPLLLLRLLSELSRPSCYNQSAHHCPWLSHNTQCSSSRSAPTFITMSSRHFVPSTNSSVLHPDWATS